MNTITFFGLLAVFLTIYFAKVSNAFKCYECDEREKKVEEGHELCKENMTESNSRDKPSGASTCYTLYLNNPETNETIIVRTVDEEKYCKALRDRWETPRKENNNEKLKFLNCTECYEPLCNNGRYYSAGNGKAEETKPCKESAATKIELQYFHIIYITMFCGALQLYSYLKNSY